jgi:hypothetical protein
MCSAQAPAPSPRFDPRHLDRRTSGRLTPTIVSELRALLPSGGIGREKKLLVDVTGVGRQVVDYMRRERFTAILVLMIGGDMATFESGGRK